MSSFGDLRQPFRQTAWLISLACIFATSISAGTPEIETRLKSEYPKAKAHLERAYSRIEASGTLNTGGTETQPGRTATVRIVISGLQRKAIVTQYGPNDHGETVPRIERVYCIGKQATFVIMREIGKGGGYKIEHVGKLSAQGTAQRGDTAYTGVHIACWKIYQLSIQSQPYGYGCNP
jgi:hypothetical protein